MSINKIHEKTVEWSVSLLEKVKEKIQKDINSNGRNSDVVEGYTRSILIIDGMIDKVKNVTLPENVE